MVNYESFERVVERVLKAQPREYARDSEEKLLRAFRALDPAGNGMGLGYRGMDRVRVRVRYTDGKGIVRVASVLHWDGL